MSVELTGDSLAVDELPPGKVVQWLHPQFDLGLMVCRLVDGGDFPPQVKVWHNICPHQARPLNYAPGLFLQTPTGDLVCAAHGATFALSSGTCIAGPCKGADLKTVKTIINNGQLRLA